MDYGIKKLPCHRILVYVLIEFEFVLHTKARKHSHSIFLTLHTDSMFFNVVIVPWLPYQSLAWMARAFPNF